MKKRIALLIAVILCFTAFTGCGEANMLVMGTASSTGTFYSRRSRESVKFGG